MAIVLGSFARAGTPPVRVLDDFSNASAWHAEHSDDVSASLHEKNGAVCLDFDFNGVSGYASIKRALPIAFHGNYALSVRVRGQSPVNTLQLKLIDASGYNVWWINRPDFHVTDQWQTLRAERDAIAFAWGPSKDHALRRTASVELAVAAGKGGSGQVCFDDLKLQPLPPPRTSWPPVVVRATSALPDHAAAAAIDGNAESAWRSDPARGSEQSLTLDFGAPRPFGGLVLHWLPSHQATRYDVLASDDHRHWRRLRRVTDGNGGSDPLLLTDAKARYLRLA
ncbi:MAG TPA: discoidin domain-containing protein, partial [Rhodanobacteraceae bacterium]|nr:discoidin domain-containing protein [Rhodanobacteraceae bacterium]